MFTFFANLAARIRANLTANIRPIGIYPLFFLETTWLRQVLVVLCFPLIVLGNFIWWCIPAAPSLKSQIFAGGFWNAVISGVLCTWYGELYPNRRFSDHDSTDLAGYPESSEVQRKAATKEDIARQTREIVENLRDRNQELTRTLSEAQDYICKISIKSMLRWNFGLATILLASLSLVSVFQGPLTVSPWVLHGGLLAAIAIFSVTWLAK